MKAFVPLFSIVVALALSIQTAQGQAGAVDPNFHPAVDGPVHTVAVQSDGAILIGGFFSRVNGVARNQIARLNKNGTLDESFAPSLPVALQIREEHSVVAIRLRDDGRMLVVGELEPITPPTPSRFPSGRYYVAQYLADGSLDPLFHLYVSNSGTLIPAVRSAVLQSTGTLPVGTLFYSYGPDMRTPREVIILSPTGELSATVSQPFSDFVNSATDQLVAVDFSSKLSFFSSAGTFVKSVDVQAVTGPNTTPRSVARQGDNILFVYGENGLGRLLADGRLGMGFNSPAASQAMSDSRFAYDIGAKHQEVWAQPDGKIIAATQAPGVANLTRLTQNGELDNTFAKVTMSNPGSSGLLPVVDSMALDPAGALLVGGIFSKINGLTVSNLARVLLASATPPIEVSTPMIIADHFTVQVHTIAGRRHYLEFSPSAVAGPWVTCATVPGDGSLQSLTDSNSVGLQGFYRVRAE